MADSKDNLQGIPGQEIENQTTSSAVETQSPAVNITAIKPENTGRENMEALANPDRAEALKVLSNIAGIKLTEIPPTSKAEILRKRADDISRALLQSGLQQKEVDALRVLFSATAAGADEPQFLDMMTSSQGVNFSSVPLENQVKTSTRIVDSANAQLAERLQRKGLNPSNTHGIRQLGATIIAGSREPGFLDGIGSNYRLNFSNVEPGKRVQQFGNLINGTSTELAHGSLGPDIVNVVRVMAASTASVGTHTK